MKLMFLSAFSALLIALTPVQAQKVNENLRTEALRLKSIYKEEDIVALQATDTYDFQLGKGDRLIVKQKTSEQYLALKANSFFTIRSYFNDQSRIDEYSLRTETGKIVTYDKYCGHIQEGDIFYSDAQLCAYRFRFELPGQSVVYNSTTTIDDPKYVTKALFHSEIPATERKIIINIPAWATVDLKEINFTGYDIKKSIEQKNGIVSHTYTIRDLKAYPSDSNLPGSLHFLPHILILTKSYLLNGKKTTVLSSTDDLYNWYASLTALVAEDFTSLKPTVAQLTKGLTSNDEKIKAIYYWVQDNIKYIAFEDGLAGFRPEAAHQVFYKRYGDCKGMANLTKAMLTVAGIDARLTWVGTQRIPYSYDIPSLAVDNHMICTVFENNQQKYILDPTENFNPFKINSENIQGKQIMIENGKSYIISTVSEEPIERYLYESTWHFAIDNNSLLGTGKTSMDGEVKKILFNISDEIKKEDLDKFFRQIIAGNSSPDNFKVMKYSSFDRDNLWDISYDINLKNQVYKNNKELYLDVDFEKDYKNEKLEKDRNVPYKFTSRKFKKTTAEIEIPKGYKIDYLPDPYRVANAYFTFDMKYNLVDNKIVYTKEIKILKNTLPTSEFGNWNTAIDGLNKFYNDQIILRSND
ncbi:MAG: transglutaminase domain-containing protein [Cyclobacteriaceae bacterium]|nr:transglutaminase domain-containing protein [Cyclobacteriaceae bacterium]